MAWNVHESCASPMFPLRLAITLSVLLTIAPVRADEVVRILAGNITSGTGQDYDPGHGNRIFQGLDPDIALVQEMNYLTNSTANLRAWVDMNFGTTFSYAREAGNGIPNGIISRYPIRSSGEWDDAELADRDFVWARIDIPGDKDLWAISVHLKASNSSADRARRDNQANQLLSYIATHVPASDYLVIGGDFNTYSRTEDCINTLSVANTASPPGVFITTGPWPADQAGVSGTNAGRGSPYDWVIPDADLDARKTPLVISGNTFANGLVYDSRVTTPYAFLPDPVLSGDSGATGMQHMAVMRAFLIPTNAAPAIASAAKTSPLETAPDLYQIVRAASTALSVTATDDGGEPALKYTWSKTSGPAAAVTFSVNGTNAAKNCTATFQAAGDYTLAVTVQDVPGLSVASSVNVRVVQTAGSLTLNPPAATLAVNATQAFTATLLDQFSQSMAGVINWSASGGGGINSSGLFTATTAGGPFVVTAASGAFSDTSGVTVTRASATVSLADLSQTYDGTPKPVTATTTPSGKAVTILYGGSATAPVNAGSYPVTATITDPNYQGETSATLVIAPDEWALWKNTYFTPVEKAAGLADDLEDPDLDGLKNLAEYALGTDPRAFTAPPAGVSDETGFSITFTRPAGLPGISYGAETTGTLGVWSGVPLEVISSGPVETVRARVVPSAASAPVFLRLRFERQ